MSYDCYDGVPPHVDGSVTSLEAAEQAEPFVNALQARILDVLKDGGLTDEEMQEFLGMNPSTQRPRRVELVERCLVCDSGTTRLTQADRSAVVWQLHNWQMCSCSPNPRTASKAKVVDKAHEYREALLWMEDWLRKNGLLAVADSVAERMKEIDNA